MAVEFRCEHCGKLLHVEGTPGRSVACPGCKATLAIPEMLASLPTPKVVDEHGNVIESELPEEEEHEEYPVAPAPAAAVLQTTMPWAISAVFHLAIFLVMIFIVWTYSIVDLEKIIIPDASLSDQPGGVMNPIMERPEIQDQTVVRRAVEAKSKQTEEVSLADLAGEQELAIIGVGGTGGAATLAGLEPAGGGPQSQFLGLGGGNARKIVYVIDRSGSMSDPELFDTMRAELMKSIAGLDPRQQTFHVIFFSSGDPVENPPRRMVPATREHKQMTYDFLTGILPEGATNPAPALQRAFKVPGGPPELIYVLTDGDFDESILAELRKWNSKGRTRINTIAFAYRTGEKLLQKIATENGGKYRFVSMDEIIQRTF